MWPAINKAGIELDEVRSCIEPLSRVIRIHYTANRDHRKRTLRSNVTQHLDRAGAQWLPAQSTRLAHFCRNCLLIGRRIGGDDSSQLMLLRQREDLTRFKDAYQAALRTIARECGQCDTIHLFPAVPAPVAVFCGREILPKVDPKLVVYDNDKRQGGFIPMIEVNQL